ncbi:similar to Saccharomyces cerevisiae YHR192W Putative protein of unknown function [Maudiozyma barnettii]|uniref:Endoplasmic reticulum junction formation protein lunapark n=1 Tax=Maudiozyma barnettii TaxID=61262 RepID=A0A8H2ZHY7_9SACH|nr:Lnp1p [Kazachstania barnettii]CAB4254418.1 similar to Saccharomyces cerevisiae YHR192W Putative protein of unknown function [Kazachstania barnettii]CAD1782347.1 similar to Saccharomyces cerevisiae YHR192W Putative protein of unknown function [Kazachstania barnettii]
MFGKLGGIFSWDKRTVVQRYTQDLSQITGEIHALEKSLQRGQDTINRIQSRLTTYGLMGSGAVMAYVYMERMFPYWSNFVSLIATFIACVAVLMSLKWLASLIYGKYQTYQQRKLNKLKAIHQKKLNELKKETNFHETNSIIQRFSSGEDQSDDAMILIDDELKEKYSELQNLKNELEALKHNENQTGLNKEEKDVWFDKVIGVLAGGNDLDKLPKPIVCPNCQKHSGAYRILGKPLLFICPYCQYKIGENTESVLPQEQQYETKKEQSTESQSIENQSTDK